MNIKIERVKLTESTGPVQIHTATIAGVLAVPPQVEPLEKENPSDVLPDKIMNIIERILGSEKEWKALYMGSWGFARYLEEKFRGTEYWEVPLQFGLPASKKRFQEYTPSELCGILKSKDHEFTLGHLQDLFSLFEELVEELCPLVSGMDIRADKFENLEKFLKGETPYNFKVITSPDEAKELKLAKETRNCFIHNNSKIDQRWLDVFNDARPDSIAVNLGDRLPVSFSQIEDWNELILKMVQKISESIKNQ